MIWLVLFWFVLMPMNAAEEANWNQAIQQARKLRLDNRLTEATAILTETWKSAERGNAPPYWKAAICHNLGLTYLRLADHSTAERFLDRALRTWMLTPNSNLSELVSTANALGWVYLSEGRYARAKAFLSGKCREYAYSLGPDEPARALWRSNEACLLFAKRDFSGARAIYREVLAVWDRWSGQEKFGPELIPTLNNLAACELGLGSADSAIGIIQRILASDSRDTPALDFQRAHVLLNLADAYTAAGRQADADRTFQQATLSIASVYPEDHPMVAEALSRHAYALKKWGRKQDADALRKQAEKILYRRPADTSRNASVHVSELSQWR